MNARAGALLAASLAAAGCRAPGAGYERSLRAFLFAPQAERAARGADLRAMAATAPAVAGVRLAAAHHTLLADRSDGVVAWLDAEAAEFPAAARLLAGYRAAMQLPAPASVASKPAAGSQGTVLVVLLDRTRQRDVRADLLATIERPLRERGRYPLPVEVADDLVAQLGGDVPAMLARGPDATTFQRLAEFGIDECLIVDVLDFQVHEAMVVEAARFEVWYRLFETATGKLGWERPAVGHYERVLPPAFLGDPDDGFFYPSSLPAAFHDQIDFVRAINRGILRTVPR